MRTDKERAGQGAVSFVRAATVLEVPTPLPAGVAAPMAKGCAIDILKTRLTLLHRSIALRSGVAFHFGSIALRSGTAGQRSIRGGRCVLCFIRRKRDSERNRHSTATDEARTRISRVVFRAPAAAGMPSRHSTPFRLHSRHHRHSTPFR